VHRSAQKSFVFELAALNFCSEYRILKKGWEGEKIYYHSPIFAQKGNIAQHIYV
jgi:hypothetical protein